MRNIQKGSIILWMVIIVTVLLVGGGVYFYTQKETKITYNNSQFLSLSLPKDFKLKESAAPQLQLFIYPQSQPIEFGPFISFTVNESSLNGLVNDVKDQYKDSLISYDQVKINNRDWIHAVIRDEYFEGVVYEYYFTTYRKGGYLEVIYSKGKYSQDFFKIITTASGF